MTITVYPPEARVFDAVGNPINSYRGALNIHNADVHREVVNRSFDSHSTTTTLAAAAAAGSTQVTVTSAVGFTVGNYVHLVDSALLIEETVHPQITAIAGTLITLDRPLDNSYAIGDSFTLAILNMNVTGTLAAPVSYKVTPLASEIMHLTKITLGMAHTTAGDFGTFGNIAGGLTNGVVLRRYDGLTSSYSTFTIWKTNSDIDLDTGTLKFPTRSGGGGTYGTAAVGYFSDAEAIVYLNGSAGDYIEMLIQDDLSSLGGFWAEMQGHFEGA